MVFFLSRSYVASKYRVKYELQLIENSFFHKFCSEGKNVQSIVAIMKTPRSCANCSKLEANFYLEEIPAHQYLTNVLTLS